MQLNFAKLIKLEHTTLSLVEHGPSGPIRMALLATIFMTREIEASTAKLSAWSWDHEALEITWLVSGSKSDPLALGVKRTWPCASAG